MKTIALARALADEHGEQIESAATGRVRLLPLRGEEGEADLGNVEIAVYGLYEGPLSFRELADRMPRLRWIHSTGAGIESFASRELAERGVIVTNSSGVYASAMAEYAVFGMVAIARDLRRLMAQQDERRWNHEPISGAELYGKRVGIVGYGGTRWITWPPSAKPSAWRYGRRERKPMLTTNEPARPASATPRACNEMLAGSDYVVVTASLNSTSRHLLGEAEFRALKPGAGHRQHHHGGLVDQEALLAALADGRVGGAVLDVVVPQPLPPEHPLWAIRA